MILKQGNKSIEFSIVGYQYPELEPSDEAFDYDANWLIAEVKYSDSGINETYEDPCIMADDLAEIAEELSKILDGSEEGYITDFMEPYLKIAAARADEKIVIVFQFSYVTRKNSWKRRKVTALLSQEEVAEIVQSLKELVEKYPVR